MYNLVSLSASRGVPQLICASLPDSIHLAVIRVSDELN